MTDFNSAWSQLFRLNPESPQTPMLSTQELQDELALWSTAQFSFESVNDDPLQKPHNNVSPPSSTSDDSSNQLQQQQSQTWNFVNQASDTTGNNPANASMSFMLGNSSSTSSSSATDLLNAITVSPSATTQQNQQWASFGQQQQQQQQQQQALPLYTHTQQHQHQQQQRQQQQQQQQQQQTPIIINGVPMIPLVPLNTTPQIPAPSVTQPSHSSLTPIAPAPTSTQNTSSVPTAGHHLQQPSFISSDTVTTSSMADSTNVAIPRVTASSTILAANGGSARKASIPKSSTTFTMSAAKSNSSNSIVDSQPIKDSSLADINEDEGIDEEDSRRRAADEDKRRRNTAASARFRIKKKLKEQALERTAREMTAKSEELERRVRELETENKWLKSLITEKDPEMISSVRCPCHHPEGLDLSGTESTPIQNMPPGISQGRTLVNIAPSPAEPVFKKPRI